MKIRSLQWLAIILIVQSGVLHLLDAQAEFLKMRYMGYVTMAFVFGTLIAALLIYRRFRVGWVIGLIIAVASIILFVLTRMVAFPGMAIEQWLYPFWLIASIVEGLYMLLFLIASLWKASGSVDGNPTLPRRLSFLFPIVGAILISGVTYSTNSWDSYAFLLGYHHHVGSYSAVCNTPPITLEELEQQHGVRISRIAISMLDSAVDVRLEITDPEKAQKFLQNQSAILVDQEVLIVSPHVHQHFHLHTNRVFVAFFSTQRGVVHRGSKVSLVYGTVRVEPVVVQ
jgi:hypothetical protein